VNISSSSSEQAMISTEGAYDLAIEAAAKRIQLSVSQDCSLSGNSAANTSGGYFSDAEMSSGQDSEETSSTTNSPSGSSGDDDNDDDNIIDAEAEENSSLTDNSFGASFSDSDSVSGGDIESEISFLEKKQNILRRASAALKREESYTAFKARSIVKGDVPCGSKLWSEARSILDVLKKEGKSSFGATPRLVHLSSNKGKRKATSFRGLSPNDLFLDFHPPKRPKIDLSMVERVSAEAFENARLGHSRMTMPRVGTVGFAEPSNHWMSQVMLLQIPALASRRKNVSESFDILFDPSLGPLVLSPENVPFKNSTQLTAALSLTSVAQ
jgi:hypothetical protein